MCQVINDTVAILSSRQNLHISTLAEEQRPEGYMDIGSLNLAHNKDIITSLLNIADQLGILVPSSNIA